MTSVKKAYEEGATLKAVRGLASIIAVVIVLAVAALGDVMYIIEMNRVFLGEGLLIVFCYLGAFTSFMAIGYLLLGKSVVFRPGGQMIAAWCVFAFELLIIALNILLAFSPDRTGFLGVWAIVSPATPVFHMVGVALIFFLDPNLRDKHDAMETQEKMDKAERSVEYQIFNAGVVLKKKQTEHLAKALEIAVNSETSLGKIQAFADHYNASLLAEMTGMRVISSESSSLPSGSRIVVEADKPKESVPLVAASFAQTASIPVPQKKEYTSEELVIVLMEAGLKPWELISHTPDSLLDFSRAKGFIPADAVLVGAGQSDSDGEPKADKKKRTNTGKRDAKGGSTPTK